MVALINIAVQLLADAAGFAILLFRPTLSGGQFVNFGLSGANLQILARMALAAQSSSDWRT